MPDLSPEVVMHSGLDLADTLDQRVDDLLLVLAHAGLHAGDLGRRVLIDAGGDVSARASVPNEIMSGLMNGLKVSPRFMLFELLLPLLLELLDLLLSLLLGLLQTTVLPLSEGH